MQGNEQQHGDPERVCTMIGTVVMTIAGDGPETTRLRIAAFLREEPAGTQAWSPEMETAMLSAIETPEICPDLVIVESHRDVDSGFCEGGECHKIPDFRATLLCGPA